MIPYRERELPIDDLVFSETTFAAESFNIDRHYEASSFCEEEIPSCAAINKKVDFMKTNHKPKMKCAVFVFAASAAIVFFTAGVNLGGFTAIPFIFLAIATAAIAAMACYSLNDHSSQALEIKNIFCTNKHTANKSAY